MREKLIDLLHKGVRCPGTVADCTDCPHHSFHVPCDEFGATADMLIANDVVPVVRCQNCQYHEPCKPYNKVWCPKMGRYMKPDGFCSEGKVKE